MWTGYRGDEDVTLSDGTFKDGDLVHGSNYEFNFMSPEEQMQKFASGEWEEHLVSTDIAPIVGFCWLKSGCGPQGCCRQILILKGFRQFTGVPLSARPGSCERTHRLCTSFTRTILTRMEITCTVGGPRRAKADLTLQDFVRAFGVTADVWRCTK